MAFPNFDPDRLPKPLLRLLPPPARLAPGLAWLPASWPGRVMALFLERQALRNVPPDTLGFLEGKTLTVEVSDLGLQFAVTAVGGKIRVPSPGACLDARICGKALDLLLLACQMEDADTLFFQRRLVMTGDTALGLQVRNLMDQLPPEHLPQGLRILLNRLARLGLAARQAR